MDVQFKEAFVIFCSGTTDRVRKLIDPGSAKEFPAFLPLTHPPKSRYPIKRSPAFCWAAPHRLKLWYAALKKDTIFPATISRALDLVLQHVSPIRLVPAAAPRHETPPGGDLPFKLELIARANCQLISLTHHDHVVLFRPRRGERSACAAASAAAVVVAVAAATVATVFIIVVAAVVAAGALFPGATSYFQSCLFLLYVLVKPHLAVELETAWCGYLCTIVSAKVCLQKNILFYLHQSEYPYRRPLRLWDLDKYGVKSSIFQLNLGKNVLQFLACL